MSTKRATKRALLTSILAICLCLVMLIGSTFAWFTDTASTSVNKITSGNLHVEIQDKTGTKIENLAWVDEDGNDIANQNDILWEPGCTYLLTPFKIVNTGNLALKYKIVITGLEGDSPLLDVIKFTYKTETGDVFDMNAEGHLTAKGTDGAATEIITVSAHMDEAAGNDYQDKTLTGVKFTVYATQDTVESDSFNNQYDKDADFVAVTPDTITTVDFTKSNVVYHFAAGSYSGTSLTVMDNTNTVFEAADGATFDNVTIKYAANRYGVTDKSDSTMTIKGFHVTGVLDVNCADGKLVVENNSAQKIKVVMNRQDGKENADIQFKNNKLDGGNYGIELVPNHSGYALTISGNEFNNITSNVISVMGYQSDLNATDETRTAAASITVSGNTFNSYGSGKAAFKIWGDTNLAPNGTDALTDAAQVLADSVKANNTFGNNLDSSCVVADFFGKKVGF